MTLLTLDQFVSKWIDKGIDFDGRYGYQCVDLYRQYVKEVLGFPQSPGVGGAAEIWDSADPDYYDFIKNDPYAIPNPGDIPIWNRKMGGGFGHVAVCISAELNSLEVFEIDGIVQSTARLKVYKYTNIIGWLHPKVQSNQESMSEKIYTEEEMTKVRLERDANWDRGEEYRKDYEAFVLWIVDKLKPSGVLPGVTDESYAKQLVEDIITSESKLQKELVQKEKEWALEKSELKIEQKRLTDRISELEQQLFQAQGVIANMSDELSLLKKDLAEHKADIEEVKEVKTFLDVLKSLLWRAK